MNLPRIFLASLMVPFALTANALCADAVPTDIIARFEGAQPNQTVAGHPCEVIGVTILSNNKAARIPVPNGEAKKGEKPMPKKDLDETIKKLSAGQIIKFTVETNKDLGGSALATIEVYDMKPGEDTPNGYVFSKTFDKTVGKNTTTTVVLTKFGVEHNFTIAMHKGDSGQEPDPEVVASIAKLSEGNGVWVQTQGKSAITLIEPYAPPQTGKMGKISPTDADGHKSAEIETDSGKTVTVMVPGKESGKNFVLDPLVLGQLSKVKTGGQVSFRVHEDGDKLWLREIEAVKAAPKKPAEKEKPAAK